MTWNKKDVDNIIALLKYIKDNIKLIYTNSYKRDYYSILIDIMVDYKKQVLITGIKIKI